jgi:hypothetical protein
VASPTSTGGSAATGNPAPSASAPPAGNAPYLIPVIVVGVIYGLWYFSALIVLVMCCFRHRKFKDTLDNQAYLATQAEIAHYHQQAGMLSPQSAGGFVQQPIMMGNPGPLGYRGLESKDGSPISPNSATVLLPPMRVGQSPVHTQGQQQQFGQSNVSIPPPPGSSPVYYSGPSPVQLRMPQPPTQQQVYQPGTF